MSHIDCEYSPGGVPIFRPTAAQFSDFSAFVTSIEHLARHCGIAKVVAPPEWVAGMSTQALRSAMQKVAIHSPIEQTFMRGGLPPGCYRLMNMEARRVLSAQDWFDLSNSDLHRPPKLDANGKVVHQESSDAVAPKKRRTRKTQPELVSAAATSSSTENPSSASNPASAADTNAPLTTNLPDTHPSNPSESIAQHSIPIQSLVDTTDSPMEVDILPLPELSNSSTLANSPSMSPTEHSLACSFPPETNTSESPSPCTKEEHCANNLIQNETAPIEPTKPITQKRRKPTLKDIEFDFAKTSAGYTPEYIRELEKFYWKNVTYVSPLYGADLLGSLFDKSVPNAWNLSSFDNLLNRLNVKLPGVNKPYLYFGMWKATFAWHLEDMDLFSINYIHVGAPKQWYVIPPAQRQKFERLAQGIFFDESRKCPQFLRHKTCMISPSALAAHGIQVNKVEQFEGEFVITFPFGYHAGYNLGFNCAESVNFALDSWIEVGKQASFCTCIADSVKLDVRALFEGIVGVAEESKAVYQEQVKPVVVKKKKPAEVVDTRRCALCPSSKTDDLLPTDLLGEFAHRTCAEYIPETYIASLLDDESVEVVAGIPDIPKDRWTLKCQFCRPADKKTKYTAVGASIQCYKGKCTRTYHVSCAQENGIYLTEDLMCFCPQHAPKQAVAPIPAVADGAPSLAVVGSPIPAGFGVLALAAASLPFDAAADVVVDVGETAKMAEDVVGETSLVDIVM
ncbi:Lysine-specific demethylase 4B [Chytriomyces hyalinus]|nr:Lysine-specific demethylase 4B [Chytriomyces hyalinus]